VNVNVNVHVRISTFLSALASILFAACSSSTLPSVAPRPDTLRSARVANGVSHEHRWYAATPWAVHHVTIDPQACGIELRTMKGQDRIVGRETTTSMAKRASSHFGRPVLAAVNADFFSFEPPGVSEGPQISNGRLIKSEGTHREAIEDRVVRLRPVFAFSSGRETFLTHTRFRGQLRTRAATIELNGVNVRPHGSAAFVFDTLFGEMTPVDTGAIELVLRESTQVGPVERRGVVVAVDTAASGVAIPRNGFVVSADGAARATMASVAIGDTIAWRVAFDSLPANITEMVGGYPMLLLGGNPVHHEETGLRTAFSDRRHPRVAIGLDRKRRIHIVAVDGRREWYSAGMTLQELADYLLALGIGDAMNFDGGGSTTLVVKDTIVNRPTDANGERAVANALVVLGPRAGDCR
jgi:exopolysaccharide biosynthesis protein